MSQNIMAGWINHGQKWWLCVLDKCGWFLTRHYIFWIVGHWWVSACIDQEPVSTGSERIFFLWRWAPWMSWYQLYMFSPDNVRWFLIYCHLANTVLVFGWIPIRLQSMCKEGIKGHLYKWFSIKMLHTVRHVFVCPSVLKLINSQP